MNHYWVGSMLLAEVQYQKNSAFVRTLKFLHDENGAIIGVGVKNAGETDFTSYYYAKNLQGDVVAVYRSDYTEAKGYYPTLVASYEYDPWGKVTKVKGSSGAILSLEAYPNHIAHVNPIRYRGYYYDNETGFYYLQSRYYDPVISRFINADEYASTGQGFIGTNMFTYCGNNPVSRKDESGDLWGLVAFGALVGGVVGGLSKAIDSVVNDGWGSLGKAETWKDIGIAAGCGAVSGALCAIPSARGLSLLWQVGARMATSFLGNVGTAWATKGSLSALSDRDWAMAGMDAVMDGCFSTLVYFYNPLSQPLQDYSNIAFDGITDVCEAALFATTAQQQQTTVEAPTEEKKYYGGGGGYRAALLY